MAFREPMGFAPAAVRRRSPTRKTAGKPRRRAAVVGGVSRTSPASTKENRSMAKRKKARTPAQKAATKRMLAANKRARSNPTKARKASKPRKATVTKTKTGRRQVTRRKGQALSAGARKFVNSANKRINASKRGKVVTRRYKSGRYGKIFRENPANRGKAIMAAAGGFALGIVGADILDRYIATRAPEGTEAALMGAAAKEAINAKPDGMRIFAQAAGTGVSAVGAYMLRKKSMVGTYLLGGVAAAFAAKALGMVVKGHLMPALMPAKGSDSDWVKRMAYGDLAGPRGYMGAPRPFQSKPTRIGPQATGSVGSYGCTRVPVNASQYMTPEAGREGCSPWPFQVGSQGSDCIDKVGKSPSGQVPRPVPSPRTPGPVPVPGPGGEKFVPGRKFEPTTPTPIRFKPIPSGGMPVPRFPTTPERPEGVTVPNPDGGFAPPKLGTIPGRFMPVPSVIPVTPRIGNESRFSPVGTRRRYTGTMPSVSLPKVPQVY